VLDLAIAIGKPMLPFPFGRADSASRERWKAHRDEIAERFELTARTVQRFESLVLEALSQTGLRELAAEAARHVVAGFKRRCFVMMPFAKEWDGVYERAIVPAMAAARLIPVRMDRLSLTGDVVETLRRSMATCHAAVADISGSRPNVMYELGLAHAANKEVILICRRDSGRAVRRIPFDVRNNFVLFYDDHLLRLRRELTRSLLTVFGDQVVGDTPTRR
jgi:hypothetical protein